MSKRHKQRQNSKAPRRPDPPPSEAGIHVLYQHACRCAQAGKDEEALRIYGELARTVREPGLRALICNDQAALAAHAGDVGKARQLFQEALAVDPRCDVARSNLSRLEAGLSATPSPVPQPPGPSLSPTAGSPVKVALVSFLFNWPSTGGGIVHTVELAHFLARAGYQVRHFFARYDPWGIGRVTGHLPEASVELAFDDADWTLPAILARYRQAVDAFAPDYVLITDSWSIKPLLAEALRGHRILLRLQAMECLCPLNNVRLLPGPQGEARQCPLNQLSTPAECSRCVQGRGDFSGPLHRLERALSGFGTVGYYEKLLRAFREAEAVLVVNPLTESLVRPYARCVRVVTAGMDPARFPEPRPDEEGRPANRPATLFFAGLVEEWMKGFHVLHRACDLLWQRRRDFRLLATADPPGQKDAFTHFVGWQSQEDLPGHLADADVLVVPTIAQEALGRTAVEAMAVGRPVIASRLGGLPATVEEGVTGLLFSPGNVEDLAHCIETLLDDEPLRRRLGEGGRRRFQEHYRWDVIIERHYRPLLRPRACAGVAPPGPADSALPAGH